jgi:hypothetical protein
VFQEGGITVVKAYGSLEEEAEVFCGWKVVRVGWEEGSRKRE